LKAKIVKKPHIRGLVILIKLTYLEVFAIDVYIMCWTNF